MRFILALVLTLLSTSISFGQNNMVIESSRCWLDSSSFSPGIVIGNGMNAFICDINETWVKSEMDTLGCIFDGSFFSTGAQLKVTDKNGDTIIHCDINGSWTGTASNNN